MATYVYDKNTGKVVREELRTDTKQAGPYITKTFQPVYLKQLASSPQAYAAKDPSCCVTSFRELERKAAATGQVVNATRDS